jgi:sugar phosphate isomerase/epimerase
MAHRLAWLSLPRHQVSPEEFVMAQERMPIGVFTSAGAGLGAALDRVLELGISTVQLHAPRPEQRTAAYASEVARRFSDAGIAVTLVFCGFPGESYATIPAVRETVGLVPRATRAERSQHARQTADFAAWMGAPGIGVHMGFISEDWDSPDFAEVTEVLGGVVDYCARLGLAVNLETGQESADTLLHVLETLGRQNLGGNFDPANMILYGSGQPLEALQKVGKYVKSCHCKDAVWSQQPGKEWGKEVPLGQGQVNIERFVTMLDGLGYGGPLTIEREISGERQIADIGAGVALLKSIKSKLGIA